MEEHLLEKEQTDISYEHRCGLQFAQKSPEGPQYKQQLWVICLL